MATLPVLDAFARDWWVMLFRGVLAILFGIMAFSMPGLTVAALVLLYGAYVLVDGVMAVWVGGRAHTWWFVLLGIVAILVGIYTFMFPGITAVALLYFVAFWAIFRGISEIVTAFQLRKELDNEWMLILGGIFSIGLGLALFSRPAAGALAMVWLIGAYALVVGLTQVVLAFRLHALPRHLERVAHHPPL